MLRVAEDFETDAQKAEIGAEKFTMQEMECLTLKISWGWTPTPPARCVSAGLGVTGKVSLILPQ